MALESPARESLAREIEDESSLMEKFVLVPPPGLEPGSSV
jgi:hypothetical protein